MKFLIYGAGGHAKAVIDAAIESGSFPDAILDDHPTVDRLLGIPVFQTSSIVLPPEFRFHVAIGNCKMRKEKFEFLRSLGGIPATVIHPFSSVSRFSEVGVGTSILHGAVIDPCVKIGDNCIVNDGAVIGHDSIIGNHAHVSANVALGGSCRVGECAWISLGASIQEGTRIGDRAFIGLGAMISRDVPADYNAISPHRKEAVFFPA